MPPIPTSVVCPGCRTVLDVPAGVAGVIAECASCGSEIEIPGRDGGFLDEGQGAMVDRADWDFADLAEPVAGEPETAPRGNFMGLRGGEDDLAVPVPSKAAGSFDDLSLDLEQLNASRATEELRKKSEAAREAEEQRKKSEAAREAEELRKKSEAAREAEELRKKSEAAREAEEVRKDKRQRQTERQSASSRKADRVVPEKEERESIDEERLPRAGKPNGGGRLAMVAVVAALAGGGGWLAREVMARKESADLALLAVDDQPWRPAAVGPEKVGVTERSRAGSTAAVNESVREEPQELPREEMPPADPAVRNEAVPKAVPSPADPVAEPALPAPAPAAAEIAASQPEDPKSRIAVMVPGEGKLAAPAMAVVDFLAAANWRDRLALSMAPDRVRGFMETLYRTASDGPILPDRVEFLKTVPLEHRPGRNYHVYTAFFEGVAGPVPLTVEETEAGLRVESRTFLESRERLLEKFAGNPDAPPQEFRVMLNRAHYFGDDVPNQEGKLCYKMLPPTSDPVFYAWIDRQSEVYRKHFADPERQSWDVALLLVVELKWVSGGEGKRWIEVSDVIAGNWHPDSLPGPPGPVQPGR